jgi:hypothetical protein
MYRGKITAVISSEEATKEFVGLLMAGVPLDEAASRPQKTNKFLRAGVPRDHA